MIKFIDVVRINDREIQSIYLYRCENGLGVGASDDYDYHPGAKLCEETFFN
jgi:hypothetical protein